jgi:hypothetical protein
MNSTIKYVTPWLGAAAIGAAIALAPVASANTFSTRSRAVSRADPLVPYGTDPQVPYVLGFHESNHDEADTTAGQLDLPF